jgi:ABC-type phosphate transport system permease subunit
MTFNPNQDTKERQMENYKKDGCFKWLRIATTVVMVILAAVSLLVVGVTTYKIGHKHGYNQLEKEIVYAIALNKSNHVGKFLVAKLEDGGTIIALKKLDLSLDFE